MATNFEFLFVRWIANLTEGHSPAGSRVANANLLIRGSLVIPVLLKIPVLTSSPRTANRMSQKVNNSPLDLGWNTCALNDVNF